MARKRKSADFCGTGRGFRVDAVVSVDERGQMVLPKEMRKAAGIQPGDKLALVSWEEGGKVCCISLVKVDELAGMVGGLLGPFVTELGKGREK